MLIYQRFSLGVMCAYVSGLTGQKLDRNWTETGQKLDRNWTENITE